MTSINRPVRASEQPAGADQLDVADGIARLMGDAVLFGRVVRRFRDDYANGAAAIGRAVDRGDTALAHRLAHTLAGAAGMIGARALHRHAHALELALSEAGGVVAELDAVSTALAGLLPAIDDVLNEQGAPCALPAGDAQADGALVDELGRLLENGDGAAIDLLETSRASLAAALGAARFRAVASAAHEFAFDRALAALKGNGDGGAAGKG